MSTAVPSRETLLTISVPADEPAERSKKFVVNVAQTFKYLQEREYTDNNCQITIDDHGPKVSLDCTNTLALTHG